MPMKDGLLILHGMRQMVVVYQNKLQFICYEEGSNDDSMKSNYTKKSRPKLPLANDFTFEKVAGETQTLRQYGIAKSSLLIDGKRSEYSSSDENDYQTFTNGQS